MRAIGFVAAMLCSFAGLALADNLISSGTGFYVNDAGWVVTNRHVVDNCGSILVDGQEVRANPIIDQTFDLAAIQLTSRTAEAHLVFRGVPARLAEPVFALGFPLSDLLSSSIKVTDGTINSLAGVSNDVSYLQISAPVQPGNSGGPLIDSSGRVLGVITAMLSERAYDRAQNVNFAIKAEIVTAFLRGNRVQHEVEYDLDGADDAITSVEAAAGATVYITCFANTPRPQAPAANADAAVARISGLVPFTGYDSIGNDYATLRDVSETECHDACKRDARCYATTYNTRYNVCFLKSDSRILVRNADAYSEVSAALVPDLFVSSTTVLPDMDSPGGDYARISQTDFVECLLECGIDAQCRAFSFIRRTGECWLKDQVSDPVPMPGVEFGMMSYR